MEKKSKKAIIIGITSLFLVMILLLGLTYAYYRTRIIGNDAETSISVQSKKLEITYNDGTATANMEGKIEPGYIYTKQFSVKNTGSESASYSILFDDLTNGFSRKDWTYKLYSGTSAVEANLLKSGTILTEVYGTTQVLIGKIDIGSEVTNNYYLVITYENSDENQSIDMGKSFSLKVNISEEVTTWENAGEGTLLYALRENNEVVEATSAASAMLTSTEDDYGTSYYFKGDVVNNYVTFSGMCWRIVRVQGDGTIKLVLADENHVCSANVEPNEDGTYSGYSTENGLSGYISGANLFVDDFSTVKSFGFFGKNDYPFYEEHLLYKGSHAEKALNAWVNGGEYYHFYMDGSLSTDVFEQKISDENQLKLANNNWCQDFSIYSETDFVIEAVPDTVFTLKTFNGYNRINNNLPSFKCTQAGAINFESNVGMLTADEIVMGGNPGYLKTNVDDPNMFGYWTLTPSRVDNEGAGYHSDNLFISSYYSAFAVSTAFALDTFYEIRPSVVLRSDVTVTTNASSTALAGTQSNPYVVG